MSPIPWFLSLYKSQRISIRVHQKYFWKINWAFVGGNLTAPLFWTLCNLLNMVSVCDPSTFESFWELIIAFYSLLHFKLVGWVLYHIGYLTPFRFYANIQFYFKQFSLIWVHSLSKTFLFQVIQFSQTVLFQIIQFSLSIQFRCQNSSISSSSV